MVSNSKIFTVNALINARAFIRMHPWLERRVGDYQDHFPTGSGCECSTAQVMRGMSLYIIIESKCENYTLVK